MRCHKFISYAPSCRLALYVTQAVETQLQPLYVDSQLILSRCEITVVGTGSPVISKTQSDFKGLPLGYLWFHCQPSVNTSKTLIPKLKDTNSPRIACQSDVDSFATPARHFDSFTCRKDRYCDRRTLPFFVTSFRFQAKCKHSKTLRFKLEILPRNEGFCTLLYS